MIALRASRYLQKFLSAPGPYTVLISNHLPLQDTVYREHASLIEYRASDTPSYQEDFLYLTVSQGQELPFH
ncbi:hypothetical protein [Dictyobacter formicarum]|uniref:Uncharacterized protein n=1 Tax=Dictyobacter formicarum TaxID=2778368 RepID=A0ABQ3VCG5_9CHLR|nr:hypothetical protein [Dictyobacter formicarum]GHO83490.1 hypothetical protein KSZ_14960 [Dictyobacter formicarum]